MHARREAGVRKRAIAYRRPRANTDVRPRVRARALALACLTYAYKRALAQAHVPSRTSAHRHGKVCPRQQAHACACILAYTDPYANARARAPVRGHPGAHTHGRAPEGAEPRAQDSGRTPVRTCTRAHPNIRVHIDGDNCDTDRPMGVPCSRTPRNGGPCARDADARKPARGHWHARSRMHASSRAREQERVPTRGRSGNQTRTLAPMRMRLRARDSGHALVCARPHAHASMSVLGWASLCARTGGRKPGCAR
eukprot:6188389-Pleurochrysis_carterae.AAC.2